MVDNWTRPLASGASMGATGALAGSAIAPGIGTVIGGVGGAAIGLITGYLAEQADEDTIKRIQGLINRMDSEWTLPNYDKTPLTAEEYQLLSRYVPTIAAYVEENNPQFVTEANSQGEISAQREALQKLGQLSDTGEDAITKAEREQSILEADSRDKSARAGILRDYANRGLGGSGTEMVAQLNASQGAGEAARQAQLQSAADAARRRADALRDYGNLASNIRTQNTNTEKANVDIKNAFNERMAKSRNLYNSQQAQTINNAAQYNMNAAQSVANANVNLHNQTAEYNKSRDDMMETNRVNALNGRLGTLSNMELKGIEMQGGADANRINSITNAAATTANAAYAYGRDQQIMDSYNRRNGLTPTTTTSSETAYYPSQTESITTPQANLTPPGPEPKPVLNTHMTRDLTPAEEQEFNKSFMNTTNSKSSTFFGGGR